MTKAEWYALERDDPEAANKLVETSVFSVNSNLLAPDYLHSWDAMREVVEKIKGKPWQDDHDWGWSPQIAWIEDGDRVGWNVCIEGADVIHASLPMAVCTAILMALGVVT